jgi:tetratricopeptide (TPR) repeat protein
LGVSINAASDTACDRAASDYRFPIALIVLGILLFGRAATYPFTNWDEVDYLLRNSRVQSFSIDNILGILAPADNLGELLYIPVTYLSYLAESTVFGFSPTVIHVNNIILHIGAGLLVYRLIRRLGAEPVHAALASAVFIAHPLQVEAAVWTMARKDVLSGFLALASLNWYLSWLRIRDRRCAVMTWLLFVLACLAKPVIIVLPAVFVLIDLYENRKPAVALLVEKLPHACAAVCVYLLNPMTADVVREIPSFAVRLAMIPVVAFGWLQRFFLLESPCPIYAWPSGDFDSFVMPLLAAVVMLGTIGCGAFAAWRRGLHGVWLGLGLVVVTAVPGVSIVLRYERFTTADRYAYMPFVGVCLIIAFLLNSLPPGRRPAAQALVGLLVAAATVTAWPQVAVWSNSSVLWTTVLDRHPGNPIAHSNLGVTHVENRDFERAIAQFRRGLEHHPVDMALNTNLAMALADTGQLEAALRQNEFVLSHAPDDMDTRLRRVELLVKLKRDSEAFEALKAAQSKEPANAKVHLAAGRLLEAHKNTAAAELAYLSAVKFDPDNAEALAGLGRAYELTGKADKALAAYQKALMINPRLVTTWYNLGNLHVAAGRAAEAEDAYRNVLRMDPGRVDAMINLAGVYQRAGQGEAAEQLYRRVAHEGDSDHAKGAHLKLGILYRSQGRKDEAVNSFEAALQIDPDLKLAKDQLAELDREK